MVVDVVSLPLVVVVHCHRQSSYSTWFLLLRPSVYVSSEYRKRQLSQDVHKVKPNHEAAQQYQRIGTGSGSVTDRCVVHY